MYVEMIRLHNPKKGSLSFVPSLSSAAFLFKFHRFVETQYTSPPSNPFFIFHFCNLIVFHQEYTDCHHKDARKEGRKHIKTNLPRDRSQADLHLQETQPTKLHTHTHHHKMQLAIGVLLVVLLTEFIGLIGKTQTTAWVIEREMTKERHACILAEKNSTRPNPRAYA